MSNNIPEDIRYTKEHEWVKVDGDQAVLGITDHAQHELGDITFIELPESGRTIGASESFAIVESVKAASDIYSPIGGQIIEVNSELENAPETINKSPYENGWIVKIKITDRTGLDKLMDHSAYRSFIESL